MGGGGSESDQESRRPGSLSLSFLFCKCCCPTGSLVSSDEILEVKVFYGSLYRFQ